MLMRMLVCIWSCSYLSLASFVSVTFSFVWAFALNLVCICCIKAKKCQEQAHTTPKPLRYSRCESQAFSPPSRRPCTHTPDISRPCTQPISNRLHTSFAIATGLFIVFMMFFFKSISMQFCVLIWILNGLDQKRNETQLCTEEGLVQEAVSRGMTAENQALNGCLLILAGLAFMHCASILLLWILLHCASAI